MARYASTTDLTRLGLPSVALTGVATATQETALDAASDLLDGYIASRKLLPLASWGEDLTRATAGIAAYDLMVTRGFDPSAGSDENLRLRYEDALRWARDFAAGKVESPAMVDSTPTDTSDEEVGFMVTNVRRRWL